MKLSASFKIATRLTKQGIGVILTPKNNQNIMGTPEKGPVAAYAYEQPKHTPVFMVKNRRPADDKKEGLEFLRGISGGVEMLSVLKERVDQATAAGREVVFPSDSEVRAMIVQKGIFDAEAQVSRLRGLTYLEVAKVLEWKEEPDNIDEEIGRKWDNVYFDGKVKSVKSQIDGVRATFGEIDAGEYEFPTGDFTEEITILTGKVTIVLDGVTTTYGPQDKVTIPKNKTFQISVDEETKTATYLCKYL